MKKILLALLSAALVAAVLISAGCVNTDTGAAGQITGVWVGENDKDMSMYIFYDDMTGVYYSSIASEDSVEGADFVWVDEGNNVYHVTYLEDGVEEHCVLDAKAGTLTCREDNTVFRNIADAFNAEADDPIVGVWTYGEDKDVCMYIFYDDQTGTYYSSYAAEKSVEGLDFVWVNEGKNSYHLTYDDASEEQCIIDAKAGTLTCREDNTVFRNVAAVDPVSGVWVNGNDKDVSMYVFYDDQTGFYYSSIASEDSVEGAEFAWVNKGNGVYDVTYTEDGVKEQCVLDAKAGTLTCKQDNLVYSNIAAAIDDEAEELVSGVWVNGNDKEVSMYVFYDDHTGLYYSSIASDDSVEGADFVWVDEGNSVYRVIYIEDGVEEQCVHDAKLGTLTCKQDNSVFVNIAIGDPISGVWVNGNDKDMSMYIFYEDHTGTYYSSVSSDDSVEGADFVWVNEGKRVYDVTYTEDGVKEQCVLDTKKGTITCKQDNSVYVNIATAFGIEAEDPVSGVWIAGEGKDVCMYIFYDDQTGTYYSSVPTEYSVKGSDFVWVNEGKGVYDVTYTGASAYEEQCFFDAKKGTLTADDDTVFVQFI